MNKKTSYLPIIAALCVLSAAGLLIYRSFSLDAKGAGGPMMASGIFPFTEDYLANPDPALLDSELVISEPLTQDLARFPGLDLSQKPLGIENAPWEEVVIAAEDRHPATAAVIRGLAEIISAQHQSAITVDKGDRYPVVIMLEVDGEPIPIGTHRLLRVASTGSVPKDRDGEMAFRVTVAMQDAVPDFPVSQPWQLWPASAIAESAITVELTQRPLGNVAWGPRFAHAGRSIAEGALKHLLNHGPMLSDPESLPLEAVHGPWRDEIPQQPQHDVVRWFASIQAPLIRAWSGSIVGSQLFYRGQERDAVEVFADHLSRGQWEVLAEEEPDNQIEQAQWRNQRDGSLQRLWINRQGAGWDVLAVEAHSDSGALFRQWLEQAVDGDYAARAQLRRHLFTDGIDKALRQQARDLLRQNPDARELAMLSEMADASELEILHGAWSRWVMGYANEQPAEPIPAVDHQALWDGRLVLMPYQDGGVLAQRDSRGLYLLYRQAPSATRFLRADPNQPLQTLGELSKWLTEQITTEQIKP